MGVLLLRACTAIALAAILAIAAGAAAQPPGARLTLVSAGEPGQRLVVHGRVVDDTGRPIVHAQLHVYQTDATGRYTRERPMDEPHARLSGWLRTDEEGRFELHTIRPGGYPKALRLGDRDRKIPAHIHIDLTALRCAPRKVQVVFADDPLLSDPYWQKWVKEQQQPAVSVTPEGPAQAATLVLRLERLDTH